MKHNIAIAGSSGAGKTMSMIDLIAVELITGHNEVIVWFNEYKAVDIVRRLRNRLEQLNIPFPVHFDSTSYPEKGYTRMTITHEKNNGEYYSLYIDTPCTPPDLSDKKPETELEHLINGAKKTFTTHQLHRDRKGAKFIA